MHLCKIFGLSKLLTGRENGSQKALLDENLAINYHYRTGNSKLSDFSPMTP